MRGGSSVPGQVSSFSVRARVALCSVHAWRGSVTQNGKENPKTKKTSFSAARESPTRRRQTLIPEEKKKFWQCEHFYFPRRRLSPFSAFHWESSRFLRVCFRILLGQAWSALRNDRTGMVPSFLGEEPPGRAACSPNESLTISGSACSQTPKVNFCLSPPPLALLSHTIRGP